MKTNHILASLAGVLCLASTSPVHAGPIEDLQPGHWLEIKNSTLISVTPQPKVPGVHGPVAIIGAASGGAFDTKRDRLLVWGGGDDHYSGNEVYAFDLNSLKWLRVTEPSRNVGGYEQSGYYPDGNPRSRHTYDAIEYIPTIDRFCAFGAGGTYPTSSYKIGNVDCLDFDALKWERKANSLSYGVGALSAYDTKTKKVWVHGTGNSGFLIDFDPVANRWATHGTPGIEKGYVPDTLTADVDPRRRKLVAIGKGEVYVWDLEDPALRKRASKVTTKGATEIIQDKAPGFVYDPTLDKFVAWSGGANVYTLDVDTWTWTKHGPAPTNKVVPTAANVRGTYGRFRYSPSKKVYVVVNDVYENVFIYKFPAGVNVGKR